MKKTNQCAIEINNLNVYATNILGLSNRKQQILFDVSFKVPLGSICCFIGHNGAGKTTTVKSLLGLRTYREGKLLMNGIDCHNIECRKSLGYIPEKFSSYKMKARTFLRNIAEFYGLPKEKADTKIDYLARTFNLPLSKLNLKLDRLSSGQIKIVSIMQAFLNSNKLIVADEPTDNLDPETRDLF
jgi:ABC-2 type transport system ATP-binding protein